jgi:hydroxyacylglutathione hydrolase
MARVRFALRRLHRTGQQPSGASETNALAQSQSEEEFIKRALTGIAILPNVLQIHARINQRGAKILGGVPILKPFSASEVKAMMDDGIVVLDVRHNKAFGAGHIPNSYGIRVDAPLTTWAGWLIPFGSRICSWRRTQTKGQSDAAAHPHWI